MTVAFGIIIAGLVALLMNGGRVGYVITVLLMLIIFLFPLTFLLWFFIFPSN